MLQPAGHQNLAKCGRHRIYFICAGLSRMQPKPLRQRSLQSPFEGIGIVLSTAFRAAAFRVAAVAVLFGAGTLGAAQAQSGPAGGPTPSPPGAAVYFIDLENGATLSSRTMVHFGLRGMGAAPAGA